MFPWDHDRANSDLYDPKKPSWVRRNYKNNPDKFRKDVKKTIYFKDVDGVLRPEKYGKDKNGKDIADVGHIVAYKNGGSNTKGNIFMQESGWNRSAKADHDDVNAAFVGKTKTKIALEESNKYGDLDNGPWKGQQTEAIIDAGKKKLRSVGVLTKKEGGLDKRCRAYKRGEVGINEHGMVTGMQKKIQEINANAKAKARDDEGDDDNNAAPEATKKLKCHKAGIQKKIQEINAKINRQAADEAKREKEQRKQALKSKIGATEKERRERAKREAAEKTRRARVKREAAEKERREKVEREISECARRGKIKREAAEKERRERAKREAAEKAKHEKAKREAAEKTRCVRERRELEKKVAEREKKVAELDKKIKQFIDKRRERDRREAPERERCERDRREDAEWRRYERHRRERAERRQSAERRIRNRAFSSNPLYYQRRGYYDIGRMLGHYGNIMPARIQGYHRMYRTSSSGPGWMGTGLHHSNFQRRDSRGRFTNGFY